MTELPSPSPSEPPKQTRLLGYVVYPSNVLRFRFWAFTLLGGFVLAFIPTLVFKINFLWSFAGAAAVLAFYWLTVQMACRSCGRILATTRLNGQLEVCSHCQQPTDKALAAQEK